MSAFTFGAELVNVMTMGMEASTAILQYLSHQFRLQYNFFNTGQEY
jgi:hypothetical protein